MEQRLTTFKLEHPPGRRILMLLPLVWVIGCAEQTPPAQTPSMRWPDAPPPAAMVPPAPQAVAAACPPQPLPSPAGAPSAPAAAPQPQVELWDMYNKSIAQASVAGRVTPMPLQALAPDSPVVTWATCRGKFEPNRRCGSYEPGKTVTLAWDVWVTGSNEVQNKCKTFTGNLVLQLQQLFGLPPYTQIPPPPDEVRQFITFTQVPYKNIFRPCPDPSIEPSECNGTSFPAKMPDNAPKNYFEWFSKQAMSAWQIPTSPDLTPPKGYPWTRLGYTYNWNPAAQNPYGASEYVIAGSATPVTVMVQSVQTTDAFCQAAPSK